jgi:hypothetical protein
MRANDALKWKDIELYMVKYPDVPTSQVLLMRVTHRLSKMIKIICGEVHGTTERQGTLTASICMRGY